MSEHVVAKFGGTSMAQPELVASIVESRPDQQVVVVSAPGKLNESDTKLTTELKAYAGLVVGSDPNLEARREYIVERVDGLYEEFDLPDSASLRDFVYKSLSSEHPVNPLEYYSSLGEVFSAQYFTKLLQARSVNAQYIRPAIGFKPNGELNRSQTKLMIRSQVARRTGRLVVPGYFGFDSSDNIFLLGDGGSDRTGALYSAGLGWNYENWTDVDGICSADPQTVPSARVIPELTRSEVREGAHGGSGVIQGNTILDLNGSKVIVTVKNTENPSAPGTRIVTELTSERDRPVTAVSGRDDLTVINIDDMGMADSIGYGADILDKMRELGLSYANTPTAEDFASFTIHRTVGNADRISQLEEFARTHLLSSSGVVTREDMGVVTLVGEALRERRVNSGLIIRSMGIAATHGIDVTPIPSLRSPSLSFLVTRHPDDNTRKTNNQPTTVDNLVRVLHDYEIEGKPRI